MGLPTLHRPGCVTAVNKPPWVDQWEVFDLASLVGLSVSEFRFSDKRKI